MVETTNVARKLTANACLHNQLGTSRSFLRRNLRDILDAHERALRPRADDALAMIANERHAAGWDFPTREMLEDLIKGDRPILQLAALQIRHPKAKSSSRERKRDACDEDEDEDEDEEYLDWLPDPRAQATWPCQVTVTVRETQNSKRNVYSESRHATIAQFEQTNSGRSDFEIALAEPFLIKLDKLFVPVESGTNGFRQWRRTVTASYVFEVAIQCGDSDDTADFLSEVDGQRLAKYEQTTGDEGMLRATWDELPKCPSPNQLLPLKRRDGHRNLLLQKGLEVSMGWARKRETPLQRYNQAVAATSDQNHQFLTPSASSEGAEKTTRHVITYKFCEGLDTRVKRVEGLQCPLCKAVSRSFARLLLHCTTFHDHFRFEVDASSAAASPDPSVINKTILLGVSNKRYERVTEKKDVNDAVRENWIAPSRPFDLQAHLAGDETWTGYTKAKPVRKRGRPAGTQNKEAQPATSPRPVARRPGPDEVVDLPVNGHRKHRVPNVPNVRFYHAVSKKPMSPGDMISDSDESVDEFWMADIQRQALRELGINGAAQDFTIAFNRHLAKEQSTSSVLMKEAMVRFTRLHRKELQDVSWQRPFRKKLEQLQRAGVISRATVTHCIQLLQKRREGDHVGMMNGIHEPEATGPDGATLKAKTHGVLTPDEASAGASRTSSVEPSGQTNGERKGKERVRWGASGTLNRESATPNGTTSTAKSKTTGVHTDDQLDVDMDIDPKPKNPQVHGFHKAPVQLEANGAFAEPPRLKPSGLRVCLCGKSAKDARAAIICSSTECVRRDFHLACVKLERRQPGWKCADCAASVVP